MQHIIPVQHNIHAQHNIPENLDEKRIAPMISSESFLQISKDTHCEVGDDTWAAGSDERL